MSCFGELGELDSSLDSLSSEDSIILESLFASPARTPPTRYAAALFPLRTLIRNGLTARESNSTGDAGGGKSAPAEKDSPMKKMRRLGPAATDAPPL